MASYHIQFVDGYGPYLRKAEWINEEQGHEWTHLGPVHSVDPASIPDDVVADIRSEGYGLARYSEHNTAEFAHNAVANATRDELEERWGEDVLAAKDDRRTNEVILSEDAPLAAARLAASHAQADVKDVSSGSGQAPLKDRELKEIDFTETDVPTAMTHKAAILDEGVSDWMQVWSEDISTVNEARQAAKRNRESMQGKQLDNDDTTVAGENANTALDEGLDRMEKQALEGAREGYDEAVEALKTDHGWTEAEVREAI